MQREPLSQEVPKIPFAVSRQVLSGLGNKVREASLSPCLVPVHCF